MPLIFALLVGCQRNPRNEQESNIGECILKAKNYIADNNLEDAIRTLEESIRIHGNVVEITELLADVYLLSGDDELAAFYFEQTAGLSDLRYYCYLKAAEIYEKKQDWDQALSCYKWYLGVLSEDTEIQIKRAMVLLKSGQKKKALKLLVRYADESVAIHNQVAGLFFEFGNYIQARNWYLSALAIDRNDLLALKGLWEINLLFRDWNALLEVGAQLLAFGEKSVKGIFVQNVVDAIRILQKELNELKNISLNFEKVALPIFFTETTEPNTSQSAVSQAILPLQNTPEGEVEKQDKIVPLKDLLDKARLRGDYEEAISILWKILGMDGKNVETWVELTECLQKTNQYDIAEMAIQEAIKFKPECVDFYMTYLDIVLCTHSSADYVRLLKDVKHRFSMDPEIRLRWASAQEIYMDNAAGAKRSYEKFLKLAPSNHPEISKIKHLLQAYKEGYDGKK